MICADDVKKLEQYTPFLVGCCNAMTSTDCICQLDYPSSLQLVVSKLPIYLQDKWSRMADRILHEEHTSLSLSRVVEFMEQESRVALNPMFGRSSRQSGGSNKFKPKSGSQAKEHHVQEHLDGLGNHHDSCFRCSFQSLRASLSSLIRPTHISGMQEVQEYPS